MINFEELRYSDNSIIKRFVDLLKQKTSKNKYRVFYACNKNIAEAIYNNLEKFLTIGYIDFNYLFEKSHITENEFNNLVSVNAKILDDDNKYIFDPLSEFFRVCSNMLILNSTDSEALVNDIQTTRDIELNNAHITSVFYEDENSNDEVTEVEPTANYSGVDFIETFYKLGKFVKFKYLDNINLTSINNNNNILQRNKLEIIGTNEVIHFPIKYMLKCTHHDDFNNECGNIVYICNTHLFSKIFCTDNMTFPKGTNLKKKRHQIQNISKAFPVEYKELYIYTVIDTMDESKQEKKIASVVPINDTVIFSNILSVSFNSSKSDGIPIILSYKTVKSRKSTLKNNILLKDEKNYSFLHDIYESLKDYYKKYHGLSINNSNKIIAEFMLLQLISNLFLDIEIKALILGKSGSGKSFFSKILPVMFTNKVQITHGSSVTRTKLLGGKSNLISDISNSIYADGFVATNDYVVIEEAAEKLNEFTSSGNKYLDLTNNIFNLLKMVEEKGSKYNVGIQGANDSTLKASTLLLGNLTRLENITNEYRKHLNRVYKNLKNGTSVNNSLPLFKPIEWYESLDHTLAKAHLLIRNNFFYNRLYSSGLDPAAQARFGIYILLEDDKQLSKDKRKEQLLKMGFTKSLNYQPHRDEFMSELKKIFLPGVDDGSKPVEIPTVLFNAVHKFMTNYFYDERNNFVKHKNDEVNSHIAKSQIQLMAVLVYLNKLYWNKPLDFIEEDENLIRYYEKFNYNTLSPDEASMSKHPFINDYHIDLEDVTTQYENSKEAYFNEKMLEKQLEKTKSSSIKIETKNDSHDNKDDVFDLLK